MKSAAGGVYVHADFSTRVREGHETILQLGTCAHMKTIATILIATAVALAPALADARTVSKKRHVVQTGRYYAQTGRYYAPTDQSPAALAQRRWRYGADPSYGPGTPQMNFFRSIGRCVMDEGYGRYTFCDVGP
jgi:hypothetical protein